MVGSFSIWRGIFSGIDNSKLHLLLPQCKSAVSLAVLSARVTELENGVVLKM